MSNEGMDKPRGWMSNDGSSGMMMMMMSMNKSFFWGKDVTILFSGWPDGKVGMYILALFFVFFLAAVVEVLSVLPPIKPKTSPVVIAMAQASVNAIRMVLVYLVMLSVMSFNVGVFIVAVAGHTVGYFLVKLRANAIAARAENSTLPLHYAFLCLLQPMSFRESVM